MVNESIQILSVVVIIIAMAALMHLRPEQLHLHLAVIVHGLLDHTENIVAVIAVYQIVVPVVAVVMAVDRIREHQKVVLVAQV